MLGWMTLACAACATAERVNPGWRLPEVSAWCPRAAALIAVQLAVVLVAGCHWDYGFRGDSLLSLSDTLPSWAAGLTAYLVATFVFYWWHRARHASDLLWRCLHQVHHSAQRLETATAFYKHPLEMAADCVIGGTLAYAVLGLDPAAGAFYVLCSVFAELFYHANCRTPRWVGYVFQRPEMHRVHHERGHHRCNYGDLVCWDMLFGTWDNPSHWEGECGFDNERSDDLAGMLAFHDVHERRSPQ
jgi:sterol desaturase/sphingolipid hydroxylase (fatty acid hydroxylase superfamily)